MYKTETHLHVKEISRCGRLTAREMVEYYKAEGYHTIFVTDHFESDTMEPHSELGWAENVHRHFGGYRLAKAAGEELGLTVLPGVEIELTYYANHYLLYGDVEDFLTANERIYERSPSEFYELCRAAGILVFQAHPYRDGKCYPTPDTVDGIEVYNSNSRHEDFSPRSLALARAEGKYMLSGSDAHRPEDVAGAGIITERPIESVEELISTIKSGEYELIREAGKVYIASDPHADLDFPAILDYLDMACENDLLILLGDQEFGFDNTPEGAAYTEWLCSHTKNIAFIDGNHDNMDLLATYPEEEWCGGRIRRINEHLIYLPRGEIYDIGGKTVFVFGGCKSSDKWKSAGKPWYAEENPTKEEVDRAIERLAAAGNRVDYILTHKYERGIDKNISEELYRLCDYIEQNVEYKRWFYGHWHSENDIDPKHKQVYRTLRELR